MYTCSTWKHDLWLWLYSAAIISLEEFIEGALDDDWIREMLECDPSTVKVERPLRRDAALGIHSLPL